MKLDLSKSIPLEEDENSTKLDLSKSIPLDVSKSLYKEESPLSPVFAGIRKFGQSASAGLTEPAAAGVSALIDKGLQATGKLPERSLKDSYNEYRNNQANSLRKQQENNPISSTIGEIGGLVAPGSLFGKAYEGAGKAVEYGAPLLEKIPEKLGAQALTKAALKGSLANVAYQGVNPDSTTSPLANAAYGAGGEILGEGLQSAGNSLLKVPSKIMNRAIGMTSKEIQKGKDIGQELVNRGLFGTKKGLLNKAQEGLDLNEEKLQGLLKNSGPINKDTIINELNNLKSEYSSRPLSKPEVGTVESLLSELNEPQYQNLTASDANVLKRKLYNQIGDRAYMQDVVPAKKETLQAMARGLKKSIEEVSPQTSGINNELSIYGRLKNKMTEAQAKSEAKSPFTVKRILGDMLASTAGTAAGGPIGGAAAAIGSEVARSTPGQTSSAVFMNYLLNFLKKSQAEKLALPAAVSASQRGNVL